MKIQHLFWLACAPLGLLSAQASFFEGSPGRRGNVLIVTAAGARPPKLQGIVLLPLDCSGRTRLSELADDQCRRRTDVPGAARLLLPKDKGSLYKYRRDSSPGGAADFGYFIVGASGVARSVFEVPGTGLVGADDPLPSKVAVATNGRAVLAATSVAAGGDLWEIDLVTATAVNRTANIGPQSFKPSGLLLQLGWGLGVSESGAFRFDRRIGSQAGLVGLPAPFLWFGPDVVRSADESSAAFVAGDDETRAFVLTCRSTGGAIKASTLPTRIPGAGFLPEKDTGPWLALSPDGSRVAWRVEGPSSECFVGETGQGRAPELQVTSSDRFDNTLNETGVIAFFDPDSIVLVVGRREGVQIGRADLFRADLLPGRTLVGTNLSRTSDILAPPFDYGDLNTADGLYQVTRTASPSFLVHERKVNREGTLLWVDATTGPVEFLDQVESLNSLDVAGSYLVAGVHRSPGVDYPLVGSLNLLQIPGGGLGTLPIALPQGSRLSRQVGSRSKDLFSAVLELDVGEWLGRLKLPSTTGFALTSLVNYGPTVGLTEGGAVLACRTITGVRVTFAWSDLGIQVLHLDTGAGFLLPGL